MTGSFARKIFKKHPVVFNSVIYGGLYAGAELSQQIISRRMTTDKRDLDEAAIGRFLVIGSLINSPTLYHWYKWLDRKFTGSGAGIVFRKILMDQLIMSPLIYFAFYVSMSLMEGKSDVFEECRRKFINTLLVSYLFWIPVQAINFVFVPSQSRVIYLGVSSFAWVNILCTLKQSD